MAGDLLPLTPTVFHILLALADEPRHGLGIVDDVERATGGRVSFGPGTLYGTLKRMVAAGLIQESRGRHATIRAAAITGSRLWAEKPPSSR